MLCRAKSHLPVEASPYIVQNFPPPPLPPHHALRNNGLAQAFPHRMMQYEEEGEEEEKLVPIKGDASWSKVTLKARSQRVIPVHDRS